ncbi:MAG: insulinase family protein [Deltaproteobacteria bacterium]|nr:insulinase family protein [Deltaproteobacteria bacterium]
MFLLPDRDVPLVRVFAVFRGGSVYDPPEKAGLAQVLSLAWRSGGAGGLAPEALDDLLEGRGMDLSLGLGRDKGSASLTVLTADLDQGLDVLARLVREPTFRPDRVEWATAQVKDGIRREVDDPDTLAFRELRRALYRGHPRGVIATEETVGRVTRDDVVALHRRLVTEGTWALGAVGDFDPDALLEALERRFGPLPGEGTGFPPLPAAPEPAPRTVLVPKALPQSTVVWARFGPLRLSPEFYPLDLADYLLGGGGFQSLLVREVRSDRGLAYSVGSFYDAYPEFGVLGVLASTKKESTAEVVELLAAVREGAARRGFSPEDVARGKESLENRYVFLYEDPASSVREQLALAVDGLPLDLPAAYLPSLRAVSTDQVASAARRYFPRVPGVTVVVGDVDPAADAWKGGAPVEVVRLP